MTSETPANDTVTTGDMPAVSGRSIRRTQAPASSSGKHPLPAPWPQYAVSEPFSDAEDVSLTPVIVSNAEDMSLTPAIAPTKWLPEPDYWLADHQRIPRPPTRPIARPQRFRRMSPVQSSLLAVIILIGVIAIGAGMMEAGRISGDFFNSFFNAPHVIPTAHPTNPIATPTTTADLP